MAARSLRKMAGRSSPSKTLSRAYAGACPRPRATTRQPSAPYWIWWTTLDGSWAVAATAHPAKFESIVEPLVGAHVPPPPALAELLQRPAHADPVPADYDAFVAELRRE